MKFGVFDHVDCSGVSLTDHLENRIKIAEVYDRCGIHGYHIAEHHGTPLGFASSPNILLAAIAGRTTRLKIGPLIYILPLYEPLRLVEEVCMLDAMSEGRFMLGVGRGVSPLELKFFNVDASKSQAMYDEAIECLKRGLTQDTLSFSGEYYHYDNVPMRLKPYQQPHPELWYGVLSPDSTVWAAENDINIVTLALDQDARRITDRYRAEWARLGKPENSIPLMGVSRHVVVAETDEEAKALARRAYLHWIDSFDHLWQENGTSVRQAVPPVAALYPETWDELEAVGNGIAGSPETVRDFVLQEAERTGINYLVSWFAFGDLSVSEVTRSVELFSSQVMPAFEQSGPATIAAE
ncbi:LLM class flavin-dependent oxidoreductase [Rhizorhabdus histidinilytica]|uniref:LLM class flavin-dependent oxidoreductase n=1 Tax=Rhizorhabdus histidinilytica TaxID=439228 RepID=UPI00322071B9